MGVAVGVVCYLACTALKSRFKYDDSLDVFGVHGMGGTLGAILTGVFATRATGATFDITGGKLLGLIEGGQVLEGPAGRRGHHLGAGDRGHVHPLEGA